MELLTIFRKNAPSQMIGRVLKTFLRKRTSLFSATWNYQLKSHTAQRFVSIFHKQPRRCSIKKVFFKISRNLQVFGCEIWEIFNKNFFKEHLRTTASDFSNVLNESGFIASSRYQHYIHLKTLCCVCQIMEL